MTALLATQSLTGPSFDMGFDGAVDGRNYLFGESVYIIDFIKVRTAFEFVYVFLPCSGWQLLTAHRIVPLKPGFHIVASVVSVLSKIFLQQLQPYGNLTHNRPIRQIQRVVRDRNDSISYNRYNRKWATRQHFSLVHISAAVTPAVARKLCPR